MKPSSTLTKEQLRALHKQKMMGKFFRNLEPGYAYSRVIPKKKGHK